jgi:hypothetical protein
MKTAMQELRCLVQSMLQNGGDNDLWAVLSHIDDKLEKEKEQIIQSFRAGNLSFGYGFNAEEFYNKNYKNENIF